MQNKSFKLKGLLYLCFIMLFLLLAACDITENNLPNNTTNLKAISSKNYTASLSWDAQSASKVMLERKAEDGEFASIADVTSQTSFEDFPVFDDLNYTYRLTDGTNPLGETSLKVPAVTASPLTVTLTPEASPVTQTIGLAGGSITATGANGVSYTLSIPADALLGNKEITLTPISQVGNLPLSGGLLSAVKIEPEGLEFYGYATLTTTLKQAAPTNTSIIGFKSSNTGSEFHLYPLDKPATTALQAQQDDDELVPLTRIDETGTYGTGAGTSQDVKKQIQDHPPTDSASQTQQQSAADDDELTPLAPALGVANAWDTRLQNKEINRPSEQTQSIFKEYRQWLEFLREHGLEATFDAKIKAHSKRIADRIHSHFDELATKCGAGDSTVRKEMQALINWSSKYPALVQNLGAGWFTEAQDRVKMCGISNWEGTASMSQSDGILAGYSGSADITWVVDSVEGDVVNYVATAKNVRVDIASGGDCTATVNSVEPNLERSYLTVNYGSDPVAYSGAFFPNVSFTISCPRSGSQTFSGPFSPIMWPTLVDEVSSDGKVISGTYEDAGTTYSSTWNFVAVPRSNP